jgi:lipoyl(octanoyl) transferase
MTISCPKIKTIDIILSIWSCRHGNQAGEVKPLNKMRICQIGQIDYGEALALQNRLAGLRQSGQIDDTLLILEHPPVITLGVRGHYEHIFLSREELAEKGVSIYEINRGGDVTYHGPGQIVGYPIFKLTDFTGGIHRFIDLIEQTVQNLLFDQFGIEACAGSGKMTGLWVGDRKIMALGIAVRHGISMHGFALNINTDLSHFKWINPCGLSMGVTSVAQLTGAKVDLPNLSRMLGHYFAAAFEADASEVRREDL